MRMICPSDKPTERQVRYATYLQSFLTKKYTEIELSNMNKHQISNYISEIEPHANEIREELSMHVFDIW